MRTTIRFAEDTWQALQGLAQERGLKGPSQIVDEAVRFYLAERNKPAVVAEPAVAVRGHWQRPAAEVEVRPNQQHAALLAMAALPLWAGLLPAFAFIVWSDLLRRSLPQRA
jgi:hypothetical protein